MKTQQFIETFNSFLNSSQLIKTGEQILLAVSGGVDSVVMAHLFAMKQYGFGIAHCNFQLRGKNSDEDEQFVKQLAEKLKAPFFSKRFDTIEFSRKHKLSVEEAARVLRYSWFEEIRSDGYHKIATAHHLNDSIETVLFNLIRGTGIKGISGIPVINGRIIRPLLFASKQEIEQFAQENNLDFRIDETNATPQFARNRIRNEIIPLMKNLNPSLEATFANNIKHFREAELIFEEFMQRKISKIVEIKGDATYIPIESLRHLNYTNSLLHFLLSSKGFNEDQAGNIISAFGQSGKQFQSLTHRLIVDRRYLILVPLQESRDVNMQILQENKSVDAGSFKLLFDYSRYNPNMKFNTSNQTACFDSDKIEFPLLLRKWKKGDYLYPLGMTKKNSSKPGKKKVSDILTDLKIDLLQKENTYVLLSGEKIIWIVGIKQDGRYKIDEHTKRLLKIKFVPG